MSKAQDMGRARAEGLDMALRLARAAEEEVTGRPEEKCEYCHTDIDGYTNALDKQAHAYIWVTNGQYGLELRACGWNERIEINFCPMCGRRLSSECNN